MCGLIALVAKNKRGFFGKEVDMFTQMLFADQLRGADGTGIFYNQRDKIKVVKAPVASSDFVCTKEYDFAEKEVYQNSNFVVGHNRAATVGKHTTENTHPFKCGHITLVHNGTLVSHKHLADTENDSHAICSSIAKEGFHKTIKNVNGAYTLIWFDEKQKTLNLCHNIQRPLYLVETPDLFCFLSEPKLAEWIFSRNSMNVKSTTFVPVNTLIQFELGTWDKYEKSEYTPYTYVSQTWQPNTFSPHYTPPTQTTTPPTTTATKGMIGREITFIPVEIDPEMPEKLIGEWEDTVTGEIIECRFWARNPKAAQELLKHDALKGTVSHTGWQPNNRAEFFILRSVYQAKVTALLTQKKTEVETANGKKLTSQQASVVSKTPCLSCLAPIGKILTACDIYEEKGTLSGMCPDCTDHMYRNQKTGMYQQ